MWLIVDGRHFLPALFVCLLVAVTFTVFSIILEDTYEIAEKVRKSVPISGSKNIFFIESRSIIGGVSYFCPRQSCAIESAARLNPDWNIYVFVILDQELQDNPYLHIIQSYSNVELRLINMLEFTKGTPIEERIKMGLTANKEWIVSHTSDALRYTILFKHAGIYLDTDHIVLKSFNSLSPNFAAQQDGQDFIRAGSAIVGFSDDSVGRWMAEAVAKDYGANYTGDYWDESALSTLSRAIDQVCGTTERINATQSQCQGFHLYPAEEFFSIPYYRPNLLFDEAAYEEAERMIENSTTVHFWNFVTKDMVSEKEKKSLICELARKHCPLSYEAGPQYCL